MIRALIVDDEPLARDGLRVRLGSEADVEVVGEAIDGEDAIEKIATLAPDLVFLDVQMPEVDGFQVLDRVAAIHLPVVVFITAHDEFAVRAFEANALDYLLKPFSGARLGEALRRARAELASGESRRGPERIGSLLETLDARPRPTDRKQRPIGRFVVGERGRFVLVRADEIEWIEAAGNYVRLHARGKEFLVRRTLKELDARLDPERFVRVHRSAMVNVDRVREIRPDHGDYDVVLDTGAIVRMTRSYRNGLLPP